MRYNHRQKNCLPCNHLDIGALRLPTLARNEAFAFIDMFVAGSFTEMYKHDTVGQVIG